MREVKLSDINILDIGGEIQIIGGIWAGKGKVYLTIFSDEHIENEEIVLLPMTNEEWEKFLRQTDLLETEILRSGPTGIIKAVIRKSQRQIDANIQWAVFRRDNYACRYCGRDNVPLSVDHIDLWEEGGATTEEDLLATCKPCNRTRGRRAYEEWIKSEDYQRISRNLTTEQKSANLELIEKLPYLKNLRVKNIRSR